MVVVHHSLLGWGLDLWVQVMIVVVLSHLELGCQCHWSWQMVKKVMWLARVWCSLVQEFGLLN